MLYRDAQAKINYLKDYRPPEFLIDSIDLYINLGDEETLVTATLSMRRAETGAKNNPLVLDGQALELREIGLNDTALKTDDYRVDAESLTVFSVPDAFQLKTKVAIKPQENTSLEGLYKSSCMYCTQCEAEGFRKITYYLDRPDVMADFTTTIEADKKACPVLLSNGNPVDKGELKGGRHWATWRDPFKKPAYLFAMVAGQLACIEDSFTTMSGREVALRIYVEEKDLDKCDHAMSSLKNSMVWDEQVYGREYDLDIFMIVAVDDFNMGAMENKGLNIFNTSCVLAKPETTTDAGFQRVEAVVAHEYFHNWSGNRVTCRDWFQLSLKEGFTVFRDAEFSADMGSPTVKRVEDVNLLRTLQFAEDGGPTAHPVQPASFMEISNFYTLTIYEKGAEVVRMIHTLLGPEAFRKGSDLYFERHDGQAVTIEDFTAAMAEVSGRDFNQFHRWYTQAGTPRLWVRGTYDQGTQTYRLDVKQSCPPTPEGKDKQPFLVPLRLGLVGSQGDLPLYAADIAEGETEVVLEVSQAEQSFVFEQVAEAPVPSLLRGFSAPVKLDYPYSREELVHLMARDSDGFNRWEACNQLALAVLQDLVSASVHNTELELDSRLVEAYRGLLTDTSLDRAMVALMLSLPTEAYLSEEADTIEVEAIHQARQFARRTLGGVLEREFMQVYQTLQAESKNQSYAASGEQIARRSLKNIALAYLMQSDGEPAIDLAHAQYQHADNMTDASAALAVLVNSEAARGRGITERVLADFYQRWRHEALVVNLWLQIQAQCTLPGGLERVYGLLEHEAFDITNPNKVRSVIGAFCAGNAINFHRPDGEAYHFLTDQILSLDRLNPQIASRLVTPLTRWRKYPARCAEQMQNQLERLMGEPGLSKDVYEIVNKSLA
ncbi:MAG TPA: aminopeptidase N [Porticoccaceae bacterium]|nr:aminopeptidase N [Porticoccaceae bacterium]HCO58837.1 aminopeptidase N [Porticoccaceae bacterium]